MRHTEAESHIGIGNATEAAASDLGDKRSSGVHVEPFFRLRGQLLNLSSI